MKIIILSAGQGRRLLPLTAARPKCGVEIAGRSILAWQVGEIARCSGVDEVVVVSGFHADVVDSLVAKLTMVPVRTLHNPFYDASDNMGTCWIARHEMTAPFVILNGDTLFEAPILQRLLDSPEAPVTLVTDHKDEYDEDDMKVVVENGVLRRVGKRLAADSVNGESIGMMAFRGTGPRLFVDRIETLMRTERGLNLWYLSAIDDLARDGNVRACDIHPLSWCEVDDRDDLENAAKVVSGWHGRASLAAAD